jgi:hypothetical protein
MLKPFHRALIGLVLAVPAASASSRPACPSVPATKVVDRLSDLPPEIRADLASVYRDMGERRTPIRTTDAPDEREMKLPTSRFFQGLLMKNEWLVQYQLAYGGRRTLGYLRGPDGRFTRSPLHYLTGPYCETLQAIREGIGNPGTVNF